MVVWFAIALPCPLGICLSTVCLPLATAAPARRCLHSEVARGPAPPAATLCDRVGSSYWQGRQRSRRHTSSGFRNVATAQGGDPIRRLLLGLRGQCGAPYASRRRREFVTASPHGACVLASIMSFVYDTDTKKDRHDVVARSGQRTDPIDHHGPGRSAGTRAKQLELEYRQLVLVPRSIG